LDAAALQARVSDKKDLTRSIVGDLLTVDLAPESYDVIYNAYVLEHIPTAEKALDNFVRWLKPGGVLILTMPDRDSAYGFMTRLTPHFVHVLYYRYAWKLKDAGKPGFAPYRTFYDKVVSRKGIREFAAKHGLRVREELGVLKGPAMKLGQMLSLQDGIFPEETLHEFAALQMQAPAMHPTLARAQFKSAIGKRQYHGGSHDTGPKDGNCFHLIAIVVLASNRWTLSSRGANSTMLSRLNTWRSRTMAQISLSPKSA